MTTRRQIMPGDLVVHEYDRPHANCVRLVSSIRPTGVVTYYLTGGHGPKLNGPIKADAEMLTRVELFGIHVQWQAECGRFVLEPTGEPSVATYRDGEARRWQAALPEAIWPRSHVVDRWWTMRGEAA